MIADLAAWQADSTSANRLLSSPSDATNRRCAPGSELAAEPDQVTVCLLLLLLLACSTLSVTLGRLMSTQRQACAHCQLPHTRQVQTSTRPTWHMLPPTPPGSHQLYSPMALQPTAQTQLSRARSPQPQQQQQTALLLLMLLGVALGGQLQGGTGTLLLLRASGRVGRMR